MQLRHGLCFNPGMGVEIERKFCVETDGWRDHAAALGVLGKRMRQGYLCLEPARVVRVRASETAAWLTVKGPTSGATRAEFEFSIAVADANEMLDTLCLRPIIDKTRTRIPAGPSQWWEIDVFGGENAGLVVAEIELESPDQAFARPAWLGREVTSDPRYFNSNLINHPYRDWDPGSL